MKLFKLMISTFILASCAGNGGESGGSSASKNSDSGNTEKASKEYLVVTASDSALGNEAFSILNNKLTLLGDLNSGSSDSNPNSFLSINNKIVFKANNGTKELLYVSDGTANSAELMPVTMNSVIGNTPGEVEADILFKFGDTIFFPGEYYSSGASTNHDFNFYNEYETSAGPQITLDSFSGFTDAYIDLYHPGSSSYGQFSGVFTHDLDYFITYTDKDGMNHPENHYVFRFGTDSWGERTPQTKNLSLVINSSIEFQNKIFAIGHNGDNDIELFKTDKDANVTKVTNINTSGPSNPSNFIKISGRLFFQANDGIDDVIASTDGSSVIIHAKNPTSDGTVLSTAFKYGNKYCAIGINNGVANIFCTDSTDVNAPTLGALTTNSLTMSALVYLGSFKGSLFFKGTDGSSSDIYKLSGSTLTNITGTAHGNSGWRGAGICDQGIYFQHKFAIGTDYGTYISDENGNYVPVQDSLGNSIANITQFLTFEGKSYLVGENLSGEISIHSQNSDGSFSEIDMSAIDTSSASSFTMQIVK